MIKQSDSNPRITVIVPTYNTAPYLHKCINSILGQTYKELEIICIDDGSTDQSGLILDEAAKKDSRIKVVHTKNNDVSAARNIGLSMASGNYIGFVDSDDYIHKDMYRVLMELMIDNDVDIASCGYYFDDGKNIERALNQQRVPLEPLDIKKSLYYIYKRDEFKGVAGYLWTRLFKKEVIKDKKGTLLIQFDENLDVGEDIVFLAEVFKSAKRTIYTDSALYYHLKREKSISYDDDRQIKKLSWILAYEKIIEIYKEMEIPENTLEIIIRMYVYRCGKLLEIADNFNDNEKKEMLKCKIRKFLPLYIKSNSEYPERIKWIEDLVV